MNDYPRRHFLKQVAAAGSVSLLSAAPFMRPAMAKETGLVRIRPREYSGAFANPLKGFRPDLPSPDGGSGLGWTIRW